MLKTVDNILDQRSQRVTRKQGASGWLYSILCHTGIAAGLWFVPEILAKPPAEFEYVPVMVVSPAILGIEEPAPVVPPAPEPTPEPPPPEPDPAEDDTMVLEREEEKKPEARQPEARQPPPPAAPPPAAVTPPPKRTGSPFGNPLGAQTSKARLGVEDPNFTYGYYLDRVVAVISGNWVRPPVGAEIEEAVLYFRIQKDGTISDLRVARTSGSERFDQAAHRAVGASSPLPPLPRSYQKDFLGINLIVR